MTVDSSIPQPRLTSLPPTNQQDLWVGNYIEKTAEEKQWELLSEEERLAEANLKWSLIEVLIEGIYDSLVFLQIVGDVYVFLIQSPVIWQMFVIMEFLNSSVHS